MAVNRKSKSKLTIMKSGCWSTIFSAKWKESLTVNSLVVKGFKIGTKKVFVLGSLRVGVFKADKFDQYDRQFSTLDLFTLLESYITAGLLPTGFKDFLGFFLS